ncbi:MAG: TRAP transporter small permease subunit [Gammaproteobacteria bacterium]|nr:TRAP transporter small permease subunit [Gammaproteobacteria bacterium]
MNKQVSNRMTFLLEKLDGFTDRVGRAVAWASVLMVLLMFLIVVLRHGFSLGLIAVQESVTYLHAALFICVGACTLGNDGHVRVDVFYRRFNERKKAWVNLIGVLCFLFPVIAVIGIYSIDYVAVSWRILEGSRETGGIPALFLLKSLLLVFVLLFFVQGLAELLRNALVLLGEGYLPYGKAQNRGES